ncbi:hypothetical protein ACFLX9_02755 [Chloroflexota bacterium]
MSLIECPICKTTCTMTVSMNEQWARDFVFLGSITCEKQKESIAGPGKHSFPYKFVAGPSRRNDIAIMPAPHSVDALGAFVQLNKTTRKTAGQILSEAERDDLIQDIEEAKSAKLWELYKASVVMCRRVIQIPLLDCLLVTEGTLKAMTTIRPKWEMDDLDRLALGPLLNIERKLTLPLLDAYQREQAIRIKEAGDDGAHNKVELQLDFVDTCIREAAMIAATLVNRSMEKQQAMELASP